MKKEWGSNEPTMTNWTADAAPECSTCGLLVTSLRARGACGLYDGGANVSRCYYREKIAVFVSLSEHRRNARVIVVCGSSRLAARVAAVADAVRATEHEREVHAPDYTHDQPTDGQIEDWHDLIVNADEVVAVVGDDYVIGEHLKAELYMAAMCHVPVRLVNGDLEAK